MIELACEKCKEHYLRYKDGLDFAFDAFSHSKNHPIPWVSEKYFSEYHARGHRQALRDD